MAVIVGVLNGTNLNRDFNFQSPISAALTPGVRLGYENELEVTLNQVATGMAFVRVTRDNVSPSEIFLVPVRVTAATVVDTTGDGWVIVRIDKDKVLDGSANAVDGSGVATVEAVEALPGSDPYVILATLAGGVITDARTWTRISEYVQPETVHYDEDGEANDSYVVTIPGITELVNGLEVTYQANTTCTGPSTLNVNGLGAKAQKMRTNDDTADGDILAGSFVTDRYDADNDVWQVMTPSNDVPPIPTKADQSEAEAGSDDSKYMTPLKTAQSIAYRMKFGGDGSDGALTVGPGATVNIDLGSAEFVVKNYSSIDINATGTLGFTNKAAKGTYLIIRCKGDAVIAGTVAMDGMGASGGAGGAGGGSSTAPGVVGSVGSDSDDILDAGSHFGAGGNFGQTNNGGDANSGGSAYTLTGAEKAFYTRTQLQVYRGIVHLVPAAGGGGGGGGAAGTGGGFTAGAAGGAGGAGGGALLIEVGGAINFTGTINCRGAAGSVGSNASAGNSTGGGGGGGGGGAGGHVVILYNELTSVAGTINITGGAGGAGGNSAADSGGSDGGGGGGGGAGAGNVRAAGGNGSAGANGNGGGSDLNGATGGAGGAEGTAGSNGGATSGGTTIGTGGGGGGGGGGAGGEKLVAKNVWFS